MHAATNQLLKNSKLKWWTEQTSKGQVPKSWLQGLKKLRLRYAFESLGSIFKKRLHFWSQSLFPDTYLGTWNHSHFRKSYNQAKDMNSNSPRFKKNSKLISTKNDTGSSIRKDFTGIWGRGQVYVKKEYPVHCSQFPYLILSLLIERFTILLYYVFT